MQNENTIVAAQAYFCSTIVEKREIKIIYITEGERLMKKKTKIIWIVIISLLAIVLGYMLYYPITTEMIELQYIVEDNFGVNAEKIKSIGLNNKDFYYFAVAGDSIVVVRMEKGISNRFRYESMSHTDANFVNGVVHSKGNKYLIVGGRNPNHKIEKIAFTLDNIKYDIDLVNPGDTFFEYIQIDSRTVDDHIFLNNTTLYNADGEDITATIDTSSGGV